jgi:hypothetical protein
MRNLIFEPPTTLTLRVSTSERWPRCDEADRRKGHPGLYLSEVAPYELAPTAVNQRPGCRNNLVRLCGFVHPNGGTEFIR